MSIYMGIDWSQDKHDVAFLNAAGAIIARLTIPHQPAGFHQLETTRQQLGVTVPDCLVGLETDHNLLHPWQPDSQLTRQIRARVGFVTYLTHAANRAHNRLRAVLLRFYPQALELFSGLMIPTTLAFIAAYNTPQALVSLSYKEFTTFARIESEEAKDGLFPSTTRKGTLARTVNTRPATDSTGWASALLQADPPAEFDSPLTAGISSSFLKIVAKLIKIRSTTQAGGKIMDISEVVAEVTGAISDLRFMTGDWREKAQTLSSTDPFRAGQLNEAANKADDMAKALEKELLPRVQGRSTWEAFEEGFSYILPPVVGDLVTEGGGDIIEIRKLIDEYVQNQTGRHGKLREGVINFITNNYAEYWGDVPAALRESIVVDVMAAIIHQRCRNEIDPAKCSEWAIQPLLKEILDNWGLYHDDCLNSLEVLKERLHKEFGQGKRINRYRTAVKENPGVKSCPIRAGREEIMENPLSLVTNEPYGVFLAGNDMLVGQGSRLSEQASCALVGWGVDCSIPVRQVAAPQMVIGPFETLYEAITAYCESLMPGSIYAPPLMPGRKANFSFDGLDHWISNAPGCTGSG